MLVAATPAGALLCWKAHPWAKDRSVKWLVASQGGLPSQAAARGTAAGTGAWELAQSKASGGTGSRGCMGLVVVTSAEGAAAAFLHLCPLCLCRQSAEQSERRQGRGVVLSWVKWYVAVPWGLLHLFGLKEDWNKDRWSLSWMQNRFIVQATMLNNVLKARLIIWGKKYCI